MQKHTVKVSYDGKSSAGEIEIQPLAKSERLLRGAKAAGICLAIAVLTAFIPILHFVLVPLFLILTVAMGIMSYMTKVNIIGGELICANCQKNIIFAGESYNFPRDFRCRHCSATLKLAIN